MAKLHVNQQQLQMLPVHYEKYKPLIHGNSRVPAVELMLGLWLDHEYENWKKEAFSTVPFQQNRTQYPKCYLASRGLLNVAKA